VNTIYLGLITLGDYLAEIVMVPTFSDERGKLSVIDKFLPFEIKRVFYIYSTSGTRAEHMHKKTKQALICVSGKCSVYVNNGKQKKNFPLDSPEKCLVLNPEDWHRMENFSKGAVLLVLASTNYDKDDYIDEGYE